MNREQYGELATAIANEMTRQSGDTWTGTPHAEYDAAYLVHARTGLTLAVRDSWEHSGMIHVRLDDADLNRDLIRFSIERIPEIGMTATRPAKRLAADILRRLVPSAVSFRAELKAREEVRLANVAAVNAVADELIRAGLAPTRSDRPGRRTLTRRYRDDGGYGDAEVWGGVDQVRVGMHLSNLTGEQAIAIAKVLTK